MRHPDPVHGSIGDPKLDRGGSSSRSYPTGVLRWCGNALTWAGSVFSEPGGTWGSNNESAKLWSRLVIVPGGVYQELTCSMQKCGEGCFPRIIQLVLEAGLTLMEFNHKNSRPFSQTSICSLHLSSLMSRVGKGPTGDDRASTEAMTKQWR